MNNTIFVISFFMATLFTSPLKAQSEQPFFRTVGTGNGLSHDKVNCILQDKRGFVWFGTEDGLNRYDGRYFTVYKSRPNDSTCLSGNIITDLYEDRNGLLWIATADGGLTRYDYRLPAALQFRQFKYNAQVAGGIPENKINKIAADNTGHLWLATGNHYVVRFNQHSGKFDTPVKHGTRGILTLSMIEQDTLLVGRAGGGLLKINTRSLAFKSDDRYQDLYSKLPHAAITAIYKSSDATIWLGSWDKALYSYRQNIGFSVRYNPSKAHEKVPADEILSFTEDKSRRIWMACKDSGVAVYDQRTKRFSFYQHGHQDGSLINNHVNAVYTDRNGIVWIGTNNGLSIYYQVYSPFDQHA